MIAFNNELAVDVLHAHFSQIPFSNVGNAIYIWKWNLRTMRSHLFIASVVYFSNPIEEIASEKSFNNIMCEKIALTYKNLTFYCN